MRRNDLMQKKLAAVSRVGLRGVVPNYLGELAGKVVADASGSAEVALAASPAGSDPLGDGGDDERARFFAAKRARARVVSDTLRGAGGGTLLPADAVAQLPQREAFRRLLRFMRRLVGRARVRQLMHGRLERRFEQGSAAGDTADGNAASGLRKHCYYCAWRRPASARSSSQPLTCPRAFCPRPAPLRALSPLPASSPSQTLSSRSALTGRARCACRGGRACSARCTS